MNDRICRCGCNGKIKDPNPIKCGYCGELIDQKNCDRSTGKWFHNHCISDYKNFYNSITKKQLGMLRNIDIIAYRDYILFQMIQRKDLRLLHRQWNVLSWQRTKPVIIKTEEYTKIVILA